MTPEQLETARKLAKHPRFRWMPGMLAVQDDPAAPYPHRIVVTQDGQIGAILQDWKVRTWGIGRGEPSMDMAGFVPDLNDPATMGALLGLVREVWREHGPWRWPSWGWPRRWDFCSEGDTIGVGEGAAVLRALELAKVSP